MDGMTIGIIVLVIAAIAFFIYNRSRPAAQGTYNDPKVRSSGSIGGGPGAHDDPKVRSSGSIGGGTRVYDSPEHRSEGSIGGRQSTEQKVRTDDDLDDERNDDGVEKPKYNDRSVKSSGSIGS